MKKIAVLFGVVALSAMMTVAAFAGSAKNFTAADLSILGGDTATTIEIYPGDTVKFRLDVTAVNDSYPKIYAVPMVMGKDEETENPVEVAIGDKFLTSIIGLKYASTTPRSDSGTFTSDDLEVNFNKANTYQFFVQVWDDIKLLRTSNIVTVTVVEKPFTGVAFTAKRTLVSGYYNWTMLIDGSPRVVQVLPSAYTFDGVFLTASTGIYKRTAEYAGTGPVSQKVVAYPDIIDGYSLNRAVGNKIKLGVKDTEYTFAADARVYRLDTPAVNAGFEIAVTDIPSSWNGRYWLLLNSWGEIRYLFISYTSASTNPTAANLKQLGIAKKFIPAVGPVDAKTGLTMEYAYFKPETQSTSSNGKHPLVIWLHGSGSGANVWSGLIADIGLIYGNSITKFADVYQPLFAGGGAYFMAPRSNEDFAEGHAMRWNTQQVGAFFEAVDDFIAKNPGIDKDRIYVGGFSIGGGMVWSIIRERPNFFAAAFAAAPPGRFMPDPTSDEIKKFASLPIWIVHSVEDTTVRVDTDAQVNPIIPWGSRPVMNAIIPLAAATGTDSRLTLLHPVYVLGGHLEYIAFYNNMISSYGTLYANGLLMSDPWTDRPKNTLIEWLNAQIAPAIPGDLDGNRKVDCSDLSIVKAAFGKRRGQTGYNPNADVINDGVVNVRDLAFVSMNLPIATVCK